MKRPKPAFQRQQMKLSKDEFRALQQAWYKKLRRTGFKDIETPDGQFLCAVPDAYRKMDLYNREIRTEYFRFMGHAANDEKTVYRNQADRHILIRFSEGAKIKVIVEELTLMGTPRRRRAVRYIIRRYEMAWGIRSYNNKELDRDRKRA